MEYSPVVAMNRTFALSKANNVEEAIDQAEKLKLTQNHLYYTLLGQLYKEKDVHKAAACFIEALRLAKTPEDKRLIQGKIDKLGFH